MVYCQRCGTKNDDDAKFCKNCSASLMAPRRTRDKEWEDKCDEECVAHGRTAPTFWGIIILLIGLVILVEVLKRIEGIDLPGWIEHFDFWLVIGLIIALAIIITAIKMMLKQERY